MAQTRVDGTPMHASDSVSGVSRGEFSASDYDSMLTPSSARGPALLSAKGVQIESKRSTTHAHARSQSHSRSSSGADLSGFGSSGPGPSGFIMGYGPPSSHAQLSPASQRRAKAESVSWAGSWIHDTTPHFDLGIALDHLIVLKF